MEHSEREGRFRSRPRTAARGGELRHDNRIRGTAAPNHKLTDADVLEIREAQGMMGIELAAKFGVAKSTISAIRNGKKWKHVYPDEWP